MENNTITPKPEPKPKPMAAMPVFGAAVSTPTVTPDLPPSPTLSTSAMPVMSAQTTPANANAKAATQPASEPTTAPAQSTVPPTGDAKDEAKKGDATADPAAVKPTVPKPTVPTAPAQAATTVPADSATANTDPAKPTADVAATTNPLPTSTPTDTPASPAANPAGDAASAPASPTADTAQPAAEAATPADLAKPADSATQPASAVVAGPIDPAVAATPAANAMTPASKGRLVALIAIIAGLLVAGIIAAVVIVLLTSKPNPAVNAAAALSNLESPEGAPNSISGSIELVENDDVIASASAVLEDSNLFFSYDGLSDILENYLGLAAVADQESVSSLVVISSLLQFAENTWWQVPVEDLTIAAEYRAHPFLMLASINNGEYHLKIDGDKFTEFLTALGVEFASEAETNCVDGSDDTNCTDASTDCIDDSEGTDCGHAVSQFSSLTIPTAGQIKQAVSSVDILATIDSQDRFTGLYTVLSQDDFIVNIKLDLVYTNASFSPEEYRPITELMSRFLQAIGY